MNLRYRVELSQTERAELTALLSGGKHAARKLKTLAAPFPYADTGANKQLVVVDHGGRSTETLQAAIILALS